MSSFSPDSPEPHGCSPYPVVPPKRIKFSTQNTEATLLAAEDKASSTINSPDSSLDIQMSSSSTDSHKQHRCSPAPVAPPNEQAMSFKVDHETSDLSNSPDSSDATNPTFFQLLETVSPHVQSVLLDKCNVLELNSLAFVSRSLREGALATMAKRSLHVLFDTKTDYDEVLNEDIQLNDVMHIHDRSDPSRSVTIEIGNSEGKEYPCLSWPKIQKLLYFCGHACVVRIKYDIESEYSIYSSVNITRRADRSPKSEWSLEELFADVFVSFTYDCFDMLKFVSPRIIDLMVMDGELLDGNAISCAKLDAVFRSRGMLSADSLWIEFQCQPRKHAVITDELMLMLTASSITFHMKSEFLMYQAPKCIRWSPVGVALFIEQWLRGGRIIKRIHSCLPMKNAQEAVEFGKNLVEALGKLEQPPQINFSTSLNDDLRGQLQKRPNGKTIFTIRGDVLSLVAEASVILLTADDGRELTIAVTKGWNIQFNRSTAAGFIDIFPSS